MGHVYREVKTLQGHTLVEGGDCVKLVKRFAPRARTLTLSM
jgi:hypothetical protein